jgi:DNA-binding MarR family transcriptional regulator
MKVTKTEAAKLLTDIVMTTFRLNGTILRAAEGIAAPAGLTPARWQVLGVVLDHPKTVSEVARDLGLARQSVQRLADALVAEGSASYRDNPAHARAKLFAPTEAGLAAINRLADGQALWANAVTDSVKVRGLAHCLSTMRQLIARMDVVDNAVNVGTESKMNRQ